MGGRAAAAFLLAGALAAGCALDMPKSAAEQEIVVRPEWRVGDRWTFKRTALTGATSVVTHQVIAAMLDAYTIRIDGLGAPVTRQWTRDFHLAQETFGGEPPVRYEPPAAFFTWPLKPAATWRQEFQYTDGRNDGRYTNRWQVGETIEALDTVVAGRFYVLRVERWSGTQRLASYWYSPRIRYCVRLEDYLSGYVEELVEYKTWSES